ncbi:Alkaline phosphatase precursor [Aquisphaera giovannonii]|uniref:Alkaline phosphatase n=1 Tax=Aquisphaera giovannonii TaxID=406548 RepID=A0A5B9VW98_9BACT|nr:alkaline phosphatase [Aquisphaera giovannonii]QEH31990.1 Alkaline phosphatase precursor [Aquisphaera giovannonii]
MPQPLPSDRPKVGPLAALAATVLLAACAAGAAAQEVPGVEGKDRLRELQARYAASANEKLPRAYHFGSQGPGDVFSNHRSHSNRQVAVYTFGRRIDLSAVTGSNSRYRDAGRIEEVYGRLPENTLNPEADYADQSDLYRVLKDAAGRGVKHLFLVWFDGMDWPTTRAAAIVKSGKVYDEGRGSGLFFQDYTAGGSTQYGYVVTSPTHDFTVQDVDRQVVTVPGNSLPGGYDAQIAGPNPWTLGPLGPKAPGYFKGQNANAVDKAGVLDAGRILHAYTDSSQSAAEIVSGVKSYNSGLNVADDSRIVPTLFHQLQEQGWKTGTVTSVPFNHASPAGMYAQNVERDDYQDLARNMLGLPSIIQEVRGSKLYPGLDVVMGTGYGIVTTSSSLKMQGKNGVAGPLFITDADRAAVDVRNGGKYVCVHTEPNAEGGKVLRAAAAEAARSKARLFGLFGAKGLDHLPYRTADGRFDPAPSLNSKGLPAPAEAYSPTEVLAQPTLVDMAEAAIEVLTAEPEKPFILFVEAGDVDFALHANNLDNAVGAVHSGDATVRAIASWVEAHSNWDESAMLVSSDHGHYLVLDDPKALIDGK